MARKNNQQNDENILETEGEAGKTGGEHTGTDNPASGGSNSPFDLNGYLFEAVAAPRFGDKLGTRYAYTDSEGSEPDYFSQFNPIPAGSSYTLPSIMGLRYIPTFGIADTPSDPINRAGQQIIRDIQNALKRTNIEFQAIDVLMVIAALDSCYQTYNCIKRGYQLAQSVNPMNENIPEMFGAALGLEITDLRDNLADIYFHLKIWSASLNKYPVPDILNVFKIHGDMCTAFYTDTIGELNVKSQMYGFAPQYVWRYPSLADTSPSTYSLESVELFGAHYDGVAFRDWATMKTTMNSLINRIANSDDFRKISAALYSTYPDTNVYTVECPAIDSTVPLINDPFVLEALCNAKLLGTSKVKANNVLTFTNTSDNVIRTALAFVQKGYEPESSQLTHDAISGRVLTALMNPVMNSRRMDVTNKDAVNMMRWHPVCTVEPNTASDDTPKIRVTSCGTEVLTWAVVQTTWLDGVSLAVTPSCVSYSGDVQDPGDVTNMVALASLAAFDYHPAFAVVTVDPDKSTYNGVVPVRTWGYAWKTSHSDLKNYHSALLWEALLPDFKG
jgi:hypothetical protein